MSEERKMCDSLNSASIIDYGHGDCGRPFIMALSQFMKSLSISCYINSYKRLNQPETYAIFALQQSFESVYLPSFGYFL